jgi:hypothetical protein
MKKVLATVAALGLVLGVTANALALDKPSRATEVEATTAPRVAQPTAPGVALWSVSGQWVLAGAYLQDGLGLPGGADVFDASDGNDAFYIYSFKILPVLQINDKISVKGEIRFDDRRVFGTTTADAAERDADFKHVYMEWISPVGKTRFGRTPAGAWAGKFMNSSAQGDRLMLWGNWMPENWGMLVFTQKVKEIDAGGSDISALDETSFINDQSDGDVDGYYIDLSYKADFGKTIVALWAARYATTPNTNENFTTTQLRVYGDYTWDALNLNYELNLDFGNGASEINGSKSDRSAYGFALDGSYKMQDWTLGGLFFVMSGDSNPDDNNSDAMFGSKNGVGKDYNPYQIMTGDYMNMLNCDNPLSIGAGNGGCNPAFFDNGSSGVMSIGAYTKYVMSPKTSFSGEIGWFRATDEQDGWDKEYGVEFGVGMGYQLYDNLTYNAHFSYLSTGDFFKWGEDDATTDDVWLAAHALSMKF